MTEEHFRSIKLIRCQSCASEVRALPSPFVKAAQEQGGVELQALLAYSSDDEIAAQFRPAPHDLPNTNMKCAS